MKKALKVEIPDDRALTSEEYEKLKSHAYNSATWYATNYSKTSGQIKQKLYDKGYPRDELEVEDRNKEKFWVNIVDETVERLIELSFINDESYVNSAFSSGLRSGKSVSSIKTKLFQAGISQEMMDDALYEVEKLDEDFENDALDKTASKLLLSRAYTKLEYWDRKNKLVKTLLTKRFPLPSVLEWVEEHMEQD